MTEFRGIVAASQALQFAIRHFVPFLKLTGAWAIFRLVFAVGGALLFQPAGPHHSLTDSLFILDTGLSGLPLRLIPHLAASVVIGVLWIRFVLLDEVIRNPLALSGAMGIYLGQSIAIGVSASLSALPGTVLVLYGLGRVVEAPGAAAILWPLLVVGGLLAALLPLLVVYSRLLIVLAAAAVDDAYVRYRWAFDLTRGHVLGLCGGLVIAYVLPLIVIAAADVAAAMVTSAIPGVAASLAMRFVSYLLSCSTTVILAGYTANVYAGLMPIDVGDKIAKQFD